ncbi:MAG: hypothetical protein IJU10_05590 [Clostridia bacterium]|nr:hypothetical protein [Clostridia bacterium]
MEWLWVIAAVIIVGFIVFRIVESKLKRKCKKCKNELKYEDIIDAHESSTKIHRILGMWTIAVTKIRVTCQCPKCGTQKTMTVSFKSADLDEFETYDLNEKLYKWFQK